MEAVSLNTYTCNNAAGFSGINGETDVNDCAPCMNGCTESSGTNSTMAINAFKCANAAGYSGTKGETDVNECLSSPCHKAHNGGTCVESSTGDSVGTSTYACAHARMLVMLVWLLAMLSWTRTAQRALGCALCWLLAMSWAPCWASCWALCQLAEALYRLVGPLFVMPRVPLALRWALRRLVWELCGLVGPLPAISWALWGALLLCRALRWVLSVLCQLVGALCWLVRAVRLSPCPGVVCWAVRLSTPSMPIVVKNIYTGKNFMLDVHCMVDTTENLKARPRRMRTRLRAPPCTHARAATHRRRDVCLRRRSRSRRASRPSSSAYPSRASRWRTAARWPTATCSRTKNARCTW